MPWAKEAAYERQGADFYGTQTIARETRRGSVNADHPVITVRVPSKPNGRTCIESVYWNLLVKNLNQRRVFRPGMGGILLIACSFYQGGKMPGGGAFPRRLAVGRPLDGRVSPVLFHH